MTFTPKERERLFGPDPVMKDLTEPRNPELLRRIAQNERHISRNQRGEAASALDWAADRIDELEHVQ